GQPALVGGQPGGGVLEQSGHGCRRVVRGRGAAGTGPFPGGKIGTGLARSTSEGAGSQPLGRHGEQSPSRGSLNQTVAVLSKTDTNCQFRPGIVIRQPVPGSAGGDPPYEAILGAPRVGRKPWANRKDPCRDARRAQTHGSTGVAGNATGTGNAGARQTGGPRRV